jgi:pimeloyl-ACP methyl ester carboxylesterase
MAVRRPVRTVEGWRMHFVDEGDGDAVLLLHGNPTWGFLYRDVIGPLVQVLVGSAFATMATLAKNAASRTVDLQE